MPTINIPPTIRFALYLIAAVAVPTVAYFFEKRIIGKEEVTLVGAYVALLNVLAAAKTDLSGN